VVHLVDMSKPMSPQKRNFPAWSITFPCLPHRGPFACMEESGLESKG